MKDYHELYWKCDVLLLLRDVFEKFRNSSLKNYGLCPNHYLSAPALSWDEMLNMTKVELELWMLTCICSVRGGVSYISKRYSKASNKYLKSYDPKQKWKHIIYLGANNLYRYAMSKFLPTGGFKWIEPKEFDMNKYTKNSTKGYVLEVDLEYPKESRKLHNDFPLAPGRKNRCCLVIIKNCWSL